MFLHSHTDALVPWLFANQQHGRSLKFRPRTRKLTLSVLRILHVVVVCFLFKLTFPKRYFKNTSRASNSLDPDQVRRFVGPDLSPICLQRLSADDNNVGR